MDSTQMELKKRRGEPAGGEPSASETASQATEIPMTRSAGEPEARLAAGEVYTPAPAPAAAQTEISEGETDRKRQARRKRRPVEGE